MDLSSFFPVERTLCRHILSLLLHAEKGDDFTVTAFHGQFDPSQVVPFYGQIVPQF